MVYYTIALMLAFVTFAVNICFCIVDMQEFKKLKKRVQALEGEKQE